MVGIQNLSPKARNQGRRDSCSETKIVSEIGTLCSRNTCIIHFYSLPIYRFQVKFEFFFLYARLDGMMWLQPRFPARPGLERPEWTYWVLLE